VNVTQGLRRVLQTDPTGIATVDGDRRRSWREIGERVAKLAGGLQQRGIKRGDRAKAVIDGWMHTGDGGYMDGEGYVYLVDRVKDMVISGGENVYSMEVENVIALHPAVSQCAVIGIPSEQLGETVHAFVIPKDGASVNAGEIIAFCKERIAHYKCPRSIDIRTEPFPLSGAGKVLKRELRRLHAEDTAPAQAKAG